eukprot:14079990-Alexandrium_andersonii.AAC.1
MKGLAASSPECTQLPPGSVIAAARGLANLGTQVSLETPPCSMKLERGSRDGLRVGEHGAKRI